MTNEPKGTGVLVPEPDPEPVCVPKVIKAYPEMVLRAHGKEGAVCSVGTVALLAGETGIGKSALAVSIAVGITADSGDDDEVLLGGIFDGPRGPALMVTFEDPPGVTADRAEKLAYHRDKERLYSEEGDRLYDLVNSDHRYEGRGYSKGLDRLEILDLARHPLFGPVDHGGGPGLYNSRPGPLSGWEILWRAVDKMKPRLIVIDPALSAYVAEPNAVAPVREFLSALSERAKKAGCGVLLVAHSTKAAPSKDSSGSFDPGQVAGSAAWTDGVRGVLLMTWGVSADNRLLSVTKSNFGSAKIQTVLLPRCEKSGRIVGFNAGPDGWVSEAVNADVTVGNYILEGLYQ